MTDSPAARARVSSRVGGISESATLAVDAKAKALKAAGRPVIGFGAGEPDFPTPPEVVEAALVAAREPAMHRYTPAAGLPALREAVAAKTARDSGLEVPASQVLITNGGKQAVYQAFATLLDPGDEVILPAPYWTTYPEAVRLAGGVPVEVFAGPEQGYLVSVEQLEAARTPRTKALLFCSPSNPTGAVYPREQVEAIGRWAVEAGVWVLADEIYEHLTYDGVTAESMPVVVPELADTCVVLNGVAKTYAMTGWRVGWMVGPADVITAATNLQSHLTSNVANVSQRAALAAVSGPLDAAHRMREAFDRRRRPWCRCCRRSTASGARCRRVRSTPTPTSGACSAARWAARRPRRPRSWPRSSSSRPRSRWCRARRSGPAGTCGCRTRSATTTWPRASAGSSGCSPAEAGYPRGGGR
jgi:aspartate/methionine/tyrosine aminotransferase